MKAPTYIPRLRRLKEFAAICKPTHTRMHAQRLCVWVRRIVAASPIEVVQLSFEDSELRGELLRDGYEYSVTVFLDPSMSFDSIVHHLSSRHSRTFRSLHVENGLLTIKTLRQFLEECGLLEKVSISVDRSALVSFFLLP